MVDKKNIYDMDADLLEFMIINEMFEDSEEVEEEEEGEEEDEDWNFN